MDGRRPFHQTPDFCRDVRMCRLAWLCPIGPDLGTDRKTGVGAALTDFDLARPARAEMLIVCWTHRQTIDVRDDNRSSRRAQHEMDNPRIRQG
jgi:hypothetical protein